MGPIKCGAASTMFSVSPNCGYDSPQTDGASVGQHEGALALPASG